MGLLEGISEIELYRENVTTLCEYTIVYLSLYFSMSLNIMDDCVSICYHISCTIGRTFHVKFEKKSKIKILTGQTCNINSQSLYGQHEIM